VYHGVTSPPLFPGFPTKNDKASLIVHHIRESYDSLSRADKAIGPMTSLTPDMLDHEAHRTRSGMGAALGMATSSEHHPMWYGLRTQLRTPEKPNEDFEDQSYVL
jgi:hypothetical protein